MFACCMSAWLPQTCSYWLCEVRALFGVDRLLLLVDAWHWPSAMMHVLLYTPGEPGRYALFEVSGVVESGRA